MNKKEIKNRNKDNKNRLAAWYTKCKSNVVRESVILNFIEWYHSCEKEREYMRKAMYCYLEDVGADLDGYAKLNSGEENK